MPIRCCVGLPLAKVMSSFFRTGLIAVGGALVLGGLYLSAEIAQFGPKTHGQLENIDGIPFSSDAAGTIVTEPLAHTDIYLQGPVLMKDLVVQFEFKPEQEAVLGFGIRENDFWLSYAPQIFYQADKGVLAPTGWQRASVRVPLTDTLSDSDASVDAMFFAGPGSPETILATRLHTQTLWHIRNLDVHTEFTLPSRTQLKDYLKSLLYRERPL